MLRLISFILEILVWFTNLWRKDMRYYVKLLGQWRDDWKFWYLMLVSTVILLQVRLFSQTICLVLCAFGEFPYSLSLQSNCHDGINISSGNSHVFDTIFYFQYPHLLIFTWFIYWINELRHHVWYNICGICAVIQVNLVGHLLLIMLMKLRGFSRKPLKIG